MNAAPLIAVVFALVSVIVRTDVPFAPIGFGEKALVEAGCARTDSVAVAAGAVPALAVVTGPVEFR